MKTESKTTIGSKLTHRKESKQPVDPRASKFPDPRMVRQITFRELHERWGPKHSVDTGLGCSRRKKNLAICWQNRTSVIYRRPSAEAESDGRENLYRKVILRNCKLAIYLSARDHLHVVSAFLSMKPIPHS